MGLVFWPDPGTASGAELIERDKDRLRLFAKLLRGGIVVVYEQRGRTARAIILCKILEAAAKDLDRLVSQHWSSEVIRDLAWMARDLLELTLTYTDLRVSDESLLAYVGQEARDEIEIYEALSKLSSYPGEEEWCYEQITRLRTQAVKARIEIPKAPQQMRQLARNVGREPEYDAVYRLFSKWVHPTAWLLGSGGFQRDFLEDMAGMILLGRIQGYASDLLDLASADATWDKNENTGEFDREVPEFPHSNLPEMY
jgi:hypothetical protein